VFNLGSTKRTLNNRQSVSQSVHPSSNPSVSELGAIFARHALSDFGLRFTLLAYRLTRLVDF
jgi:hypothetical protein